MSSNPHRKDNDRTNPSKRRPKQFNLAAADDEFPSVGLGGGGPSRANAPQPNATVPQPQGGAWGKPSWGPSKGALKAVLEPPPAPTPKVDTGSVKEAPSPWKVIGKVVEPEGSKRAQKESICEDTKGESVKYEASGGETPGQEPAPETKTPLPVSPPSKTIDERADDSAATDKHTTPTARSADVEVSSSPASSNAAVVQTDKPAAILTKTPTWNWGGGASSNKPVATPSMPSPAAASVKSVTTPTFSVPPKARGAAGTGSLLFPPSAGRKQGGRGRGRRDMGDRRERPNPDFICNQVESIDVVKSRPTTTEGQEYTKKGKLGKPIDLTTNYYPLETLTNFNLFQYHVEFKPDDDRTDVRKKLVKIHETTLGAFIFDGQSLYTPHRIAKNPLLLYSMNGYNKQKTQISVRLVAEITPVDTVFLQVYNIIFRAIMTQLDLESMGRFYYDPNDKTTLDARKLEVWPGYITSVRNHEDRILLNLELTHKVVRSDTVLDFINNTKAAMQTSAGSSSGGPPHRGRWDYKNEVTKNLLGCVVLTRYNKKNYKVDDLKWDVTPSHEFKLRDGKSQSYVDYYKGQYGTIIKDSKQPMLVSLPKKKELHRGSKQPIFLVPEICQMTGLNDAMRKDVNLMKELSNHLVLSPAERVQRANGFIKRLYADPKVKAELERWNIQVGMKPVKCAGRVVDLDDLVVGGYSNTGPPVKVKQDKPGDWTNIFKCRPMLSTVPLKRWILISCPRSEQITEQLLIQLKTTAKSMNFTIDNPMIRLVLRDTKPTTYSATIQQLFDQARQNVQMFVTLLPNNNAEVYNAIKQKCYCELGVSSQCILIKTMMTKNPASVANRLAIQMNAKLGGEPWAVDIPLKGLMIVGYDVYHSGNKRSPSVGALVASTSPTLARYFASTYFHKNRSELSANLCSAMTNALQSYKVANKSLPARILLYRDGVGDGQLSYIYNTELAQIKEAIRMVYANQGPNPPKFSFIVVTKRIHTRVYGPPERSVGGMGEVNPPPGTVVDDVITRPERYDFYLVSQCVNNVNATVSPTSYNVLWDEQGLDPDKMQRLTLKLCHLYYNYTGTIAVPAPCQFAHKLAYLTGMSLSNPTNRMLHNLLYFL